MDPISQGVLGAALPQATATRDRVRLYALLGCVSGMAPDLDVLIRSTSNPLLFLDYHRQFTHALIFVPIGAAICAGVAHIGLRQRLRFRETFTACFLGYATHGLLDACTSYGTQLMWPFSNVRVAWNNVSVIDPLFTLPLLALVVIGAFRRQSRFAIAGLVWVLTYLAFGALQHQRALAVGHELASARGHWPARLEAKPSFANLLVWKLLYEHNGRFYVDGARMGLGSTVCDGQSIEVLDVARHLPWLEPSSQQYRDIERFRWFSDGFLALDIDDPMRIIDVRYSLVPNEVNALWGIRLDRQIGESEHVRYFTDRAGRDDQSRSLWNMVTSGQCP